MEITKKEVEGAGDIKGIMRNSEKVVLNIKPFMRSPTNEFTLDKIQSRDNTFSNYDNYSNYNNFGNYGNYSNYGSAPVDIRNEKGEIKNNSEIRLGEIIQLRLDGEDGGFIRNLRNDVIFQADKKSILYIKELSVKSLKEALIDCPQLSEALWLTVA